MLEPYRPEPYSDFDDPARRSAYELALAGVESRLGEHYPLIVGGERMPGGGEIRSVDPSRPERLIGTVAAATPEQVDTAVEAAWDAFATWGSLSAEARARHLFALSALLRRRKYEFSAWETFEAGKNWLEAEADVAEAIDFIEYYGREAIRLGGPVPVAPYPGELNDSFLIPLGAGAVIPPWNFPLAILVGMTIGPVAAGNTVVVKPASNTPVIANQFMDLLEEAGFPPGVVNLLTGSGSEVGDRLVDHPRIRFVNFTGSKEVGLRIAERTAVMHEGQDFLKRSFMEMGGKDALVVDETADLDAAVTEIVKSAYGFQGQKCSACSRLILVDEIHDTVLDRVVEASAGLDVGPPTENHTVGPVISEAQHRSILEEIERGSTEAKLLTGGGAIDLNGGFYIQPTVFGQVAPDARLAQHEIFGPVLSVIRVGDFDEAIEVFNGTEYGLTGGLFSRDRARIERARREFAVGNLYINRKITGALVGVQPFGGIKMSGSNAKAGGPDYLRLFMEMKTVAERR